MEDFMIPQEKCAAVTRGLREAFGVSEFDDISRITKGQTASLVYRIIVQGMPYLLKIITRAEDPTRHYTSMQAAAETGVAPRVRYTSVPDHVSITDFVETAPLPISEALVRIPAQLRTLHALTPFDRAPFNTTCTFLLNKWPAMDGFVLKFQSANILPKAECEEFFSRYAQIAAVYPYDDTEMVSSHNDLYKPDNILFDGNRLWLVDWEAAFLNDRYADLAVAANHVVTNDEEEVLYLQQYFGAPPNQYQLARFHLMRQLADLFYTMAFLHLGSTAGKPIDWSETMPEFSDFYRRMWAGEVDLTDKDVNIVHARVHWERLLHNVRQARYGEALRIVSEARAMA